MCLPGDEASVPLVRHMCRDALAKLGVQQDCVFDIELALTEACTNVLRHARNTGSEYEVEVLVLDRSCSITVTDTGQGFDYERVGSDAVNLSAEGGRGVHLMRSLVDDLEFFSEPTSGTTVRLRKTLRLESSSLLGNGGSRPRRSRRSTSERRHSADA
jgi:serine/threonine-protein kinase RsbW